MTTGDAGRPVVMITGASRGIGRACALALAAAGFDVAFTARTEREGEGRDDSDAGKNAPVEGSLERTAADVESRGAVALPLVADLCDIPSLEAAVGETLRAFGRIDVLVLNAVHTGPGSMLPILDTPIEAVQTKLAANVVAQFAIVQAALPAMLAAGGGRVLGITSYAATHEPTAAVGAGGWGYAYAASKAGFHRLAGHLAVEFGDRGIVAINIDPGHVLTERMLANQRRLGLEGHYTGAPPSAIGAAVVWLAGSPEAPDLNGQTVEGLRLVLQRGLHPDWRKIPAT
jgi:NAD(P)-dependent dehydrogenase (short-subunit alcohol dehydrogenase family)